MAIRRTATVDGLVTRVSTDTVKVALQVDEPKSYTHVILTREEASRLRYGQRVRFVLYDQSETLDYLGESDG